MAKRMEIGTTQGTARVPKRTQRRKLIGIMPSVTFLPVNLVPGPVTLYPEGIAPANVRPRKKPQGRPVEFDWAPRERELDEILAAMPTLPVRWDGRQAKLEQWLEDSFPEKHRPSEAMIRRHVQDRIKTQRKMRKGL